VREEPEKDARFFHSSPEDFPHDLPAHIGQPEIAPAVTIRELYVIAPERAEAAGEAVQHLAAGDGHIQRESITGRRLDGQAATNFPGKMRFYFGVTGHGKLSSTPGRWLAKSRRMKKLPEPRLCGCKAPGRTAKARGSMSNQPQASQQSLQIKHENFTARYANHALVTVGAEEVYLDFTSGIIADGSGVSVMPIHTRIAMTPSGVVRLAQLLQQTTANFQVVQIPPPTTPPTPVQPAPVE